MGGVNHVSYYRSTFRLWAPRMRDMTWFKKPRVSPMVTSECCEDGDGGAVADAGLTDDSNWGISTALLYHIGQDATTDHFSGSLK